MTTTAFQIVLNALERSSGAISHAEIRTWPRGEFEQLRDFGLLRQSGTGLTAPCPLCDDGHVEQVDVRDTPTGRRFFIECPDAVRVEVTPDICRMWEVCVSEIVLRLGRALGTTWAPREIVARTYYRLGRVKCSDTLREVALAAGSADDDYRVIARHVGTAGRTIVLVPTRVPSRGVWAGRTPAVIPLSAVVSVGEAGFNIDAAEFMSLVADSDRDNAGECEGRLSRGTKKAINDAVKSRAQFHECDKALVEAYQEQGTLDLAADFLSVRMNRRITRDKVYQAVKRAGGASAVMRAASSKSVVRRIALHKRDESASLDAMRKYRDSR